MQYLSNFSQAELEQVLQNRRCKEERDRLQKYLTSDKSLIKSLDLNRMDVLEATSSGETGIETEAVTAEDTDFFRTYRIGESILEIEGNCMAISAMHMVEEWNYGMGITYCGQCAVAWNKGMDGDCISRPWVKCHADSEDFFEIFRKLRVDLGIDDPQDDVFRGFVAMFWGTKLCTKPHKTRIPRAWQPPLTRIVWLWEQALGIEDHDDQLNGWDRVSTL